MTVFNDSMKANVFIAVIDEGNINNKSAGKQYDLVNALGKSMYAIIKKGVDWSVIGHIPWKKVYLFEYSTEIPAFMQLINLEVTRGGFYT